MASLTRPSSVAMSTVRCRASAFNSMRRFSSSSCQTQVRCSLLRSGIANESSSQTFLSSRYHPSNQQHRTFFAKIARRFPASTQSARPPLSSGEANAEPESEAEASTRPQPPSTPLQLTNLPYFVRRTPSNKLPVYLETKAGGTKRLTKIQKTEGDLEALKSDLAQALNLETGSKKSEVTINSTTGHIIVKGWRKDEIQKFLMDRNF